MILALIPDVIKLPAAAVLGAALMLYPAVGTASPKASRWLRLPRLPIQSRFSAKGIRSMKRSLLLMLPLCAALTACQTTSKQSVCDGFKKLTPSLETTIAILRKDRPFADQVASHNRFGSSQGCWK
jgi:hypothetical protein